MKQIWKDIEGFEGLYMISNFGNVLSVQTQKLRKLQVKKSGYVQVDLSKNGHKTWYKVHRLVAMAFIPNPENKPHINHKDGNRSNNHVENLEWVTNSENVVHAYKTGLTKIKRGSESVKAKCVAVVYKNEVVAVYDTVTKAQTLTDLSHSTVSRKLADGKATRHGYSFKYISREEFSSYTKDLQNKKIKTLPSKK